MTDERVSFTDAVADLATRGDMVVSAALALEPLAKGAGPKAVCAQLLPLLTLYGVSNRSESEWAAFWGFYTDALADTPLEAVKAGIADYVASPTSEWFPKPGPLRALCEKHAIPIRMAWARAKRAATIMETRAE